MNKKVQNKKSIFAASVLSLFAFSLLGMGISSLNSSDNVYAETDPVPQVTFYSTINGLTTTQINNATVGYVGTKDGENDIKKDSVITVTYYVQSTTGFNGSELYLTYNTNVFSLTAVEGSNSVSGTFEATTDFTTLPRITPVIIWNYVGTNGDDLTAGMPATTANVAFFTATFTLKSDLTAGQVYEFGIDTTNSIVALVDTTKTPTETLLTISNADSTSTDNNISTKFISRDTAVINIASNQKSTYDAQPITAGTDGADFIYTITKGDGTVTVEDVTSNATTTLPTNVGTYTLRVTIADGYCYYGTTEEQSFSIIQKDLTLTPTHADVAYKTSAAAISSGLGVSATGWVDATAFSDASLTSFLTTNYLETLPAGSTCTISWTGTPSATDYSALSNYNVITQTGSFKVTVGSLDISDLVYTAYSSVYDANEHSLSDQVTATNKAMLTLTFTFNGETKNAVKDVADSSTSNLKYTLTIAPTDTNYNLIQTGSKFNIAQDNKSATLSNLEVSITTCKLTTPTNLKVDTTDHTKLVWDKVYLLTPDANEANYVIKINDTTQTAQAESNFVANGAGKYYVKATTTNPNYSDSDYTTESSDLEAFAVTFYPNEKGDSIKASFGHYDKAISRNDTPNIPTATQYYFYDQSITATEPTLKNYTFKNWIIDDGQELVSVIQTLNVFPEWEVVTGSDKVIDVTFAYSVDNGTEQTIKTITFYENDETTDIESILASEITLPSHQWFATSSNIIWFEDKNCDATSTPIENTFSAYIENAVAGTDKSTLTLYGYQNFKIGLGDVNGDGLVDTKDLTAYRKVIVGGYVGDDGINVIEKNSELSATPNTNTTNGDFLKRVADVNVNNDGSAFAPDNALDIRDVCIIAMAIAGGYGLEVSDNQYENKKVDFVSTEIQITATPTDECTGTAEAPSPGCAYHFTYTSSTISTDLFNIDSSTFNVQIESNVDLTSSDFTATMTDGDSEIITASNTTLNGFNCVYDETTHILSISANFTVNSQSSSSQTTNEDEVTETSTNSGKLGQAVGSVAGGIAAGDVAAGGGQGKPQPGEEPKPIPEEPPKPIFYGYPGQDGGYHIFFLNEGVYCALGTITITVKGKEFIFDKVCLLDGKISRMLKSNF